MYTGTLTTQIMYFIIIMVNWIMTIQKQIQISLKFKNIIPVTELHMFICLPKINNGQYSCLKL